MIIGQKFLYKMLEMADVTHFLKFLAGLQADKTIAVLFCCSFFVSFTAIDKLFYIFPSNYWKDLINESIVIDHS